VEVSEDGVLIVRRIHVRYRIRAADENREAIDRAFEAHPPKCPVYRSIRDAIDVTTELEVLPER